MMQVLLSPPQQRFSGRLKELCCNIDSISAALARGSLMDESMLIVAEVEDSTLTDTTYDILSEAAELAESLKYELTVVLMGTDVSPLTDEIIRHGATRVFLLEHRLLASYTTHGYAKVLSDLIHDVEPEIVIFGGTPNGLDLAAAVAARLKTGLVTECTAVRLEAGRLQISKPILEDRVYATFVAESGPPILISFREGITGLRKQVTSDGAEVVRITPVLSEKVIRTKTVRTFKAPARELDVEETDVLVVGGKGVSSVDKWSLIDELAEVLNAGTAGTRMALDAGWIDRDKLIGQTGRTVSPKVCIEAGVSGAIQHHAGLKDAGFIIAINNDPKAPIFKFAHLGIVADLHRLIPALTAKLRQLIHQENH
jgi:electron transfer flavoprotein alpha subunit